MEFRELLALLISEKANGNQTQVAKESGIPMPTLNGWLTKGRLPRYEQIILLSKYFHVSADYLMGMEDDAGKKRNDSDRAYLITPEVIRLAKRIYDLPDGDRRRLEFLFDAIEDGKI
ncbi:MAG: helix-turn-helix transcriptional regulator [Clostridia bacterium]|nr:helix-turn-helix transcriptional regulator [Clostridia bacterium]